MIEDQAIQEIRQRLEAELSRLQGHDRDRSQGNNPRDGANLDRDDLAHNYTARERHNALRGVEEAKRKQIKEALDSIDHGTYGRCTRCSKPIEPGRLQIIPYAVLCVDCQQQQEQL